MEEVMDKKWSKPQELSALDAAFPASVKHLMPTYGEIPDEFRRSSNPWANWQGEWFYGGLERWPIPKDGIDRAKAIRHLMAIQGSFEPKHEHKSAGVAYLASLWFSSPDGEVIKRKTKTAA